MGVGTFMRKRQTKYGAYLATYVLVVFAVVVLANWFVNRRTKSWDLTSNKRYSLSDQTKKMVRGLDRDVKIYYFDKSSQLTRGRDLLDQYDSLSPKLSVEYVDPDRKPGIARDMGVKSYGSIFLVSGDRRQEANVLEEESITNGMMRMLKQGGKTICFIEGHGEYDLENSDRQGFSQAKKALEDSIYQVKSVSLLKDGKVPPECTVVVVAGPKQEYVEPEIAALKSFVDGGGDALFLLDPGSSQSLAALVREWNIELKGDLVVDLNPLNQLFGGNETVPIITQYKSHAITRELARVRTLMPFSRTVTPAKESKPGVSTETLFETSEESWATEFKPGMREIALKEGKDTKGPVPVAAVATVKKDANEARVVVMGSSRFPANAYIGAFGNKDLFVNTVNWLAADEDLISIRPKEPENRRVNLTRSQMSRIFYLSVLGLPLLMILSGVAVWWRRR